MAILNNWQLNQLGLSEGST